MVLLFEGPLHRRSDDVYDSYIEVYFALERAESSTAFLLEYPCPEFGADPLNQSPREAYALEGSTLAACQDNGEATWPPCTFDLIVAADGWQGRMARLHLAAVDHCDDSDGAYSNLVRACTSSTHPHMCTRCSLLGSTRPSTCSNAKRCSDSACDAVLRR